MNELAVLYVLFVWLQRLCLSVNPCLAADSRRVGRDVSSAIWEDDKTPVFLFSINTYCSLNSVQLDMSYINMKCHSQFVYQSSQKYKISKGQHLSNRAFKVTI